jgi:hypothetical protein
MSGDLNDFLRQAAARREARKRAEGQTTPAPQPTPQPRPAAQSAPPKSPVTPPPRKSVSSPRVESGIEKADRQREAHRQEFFGTQPTAGIPKQQSSKDGHSKNQNAPAQIKKPTNQRVSEANASNVPSVVESRTTAIDNQQILEMLRNPQSLKMAFIASEIFNRKFE